MGQDGTTGPGGANSATQPDCRLCGQPGGRLCRACAAVELATVLPRLYRALHARCRLLGREDRADLESEAVLAVVRLQRLFRPRPGGGGFASFVLRRLLAWRHSPVREWYRRRQRQLRREVPCDGLDGVAAPMLPAWEEADWRQFLALLDPVEVLVVTGRLRQRQPWLTVMATTGLSRRQCGRLLRSALAKLRAAKRGE